MRIRNAVSLGLCFVPEWIDRNGRLWKSCRVALMSASLAPCRKVIVVTASSPSQRRQNGIVAGGMGSMTAVPRIGEGDGFDARPPASSIVTRAILRSRMRLISHPSHAANAATSRNIVPSEN